MPVWGVQSRHLHLDSCSLASSTAGGAGAVLGGAGDVIAQLDL